MTNDADANAVVIAVRSYFAAWVAGESTNQAATPRLAAVDALFAAARSAAWDSSVEIRGLEVTHLNDDAAVAAIEATLASRLRAPPSRAPHAAPRPLARRDLKPDARQETIDRFRRGELTLESDLSGPVELRRVDGTWRVTRYSRDGSPIAAMLVDDAEARAGSVRLSARAVEFRAFSTGVVIEAENESDEDARLIGVKLVSPIVMSKLRPLRRGRLGGAVPAHQSIFREALFPPLAKDRVRRRLVLRVRLEQSGHTHATRLEIRP
jgi:hypothetical protein